MTRQGLCLLASMAICGRCLPLRAEGYRFIFPTVEAMAGERVRLTIQGEHEQSAQGFSIAARYPAGDVTIERIHIDDTILEAIHMDYLETKISPESGAFVIGALVDSHPPFDGTLIPNIGRPLAFVHLELKISESARGAVKIRLENGILQPPVDNVYAIDNQAVHVTELTEGTILLPGDEGGGASFLRGDFNMDSQLDISDPIGILSHTFYGGPTPPCLVAADANDDERVDISDPIFLLAHLFTQGRPPPPPARFQGPDPTPGELGCGLPLNP